MADEISKETLKEEIEKLLKNADLSKTSVKKVIQELEKKLDVELRSRKAEIDQIVMDHINSIDSEEERTKQEDHINSIDSEEERTKQENEVDDADSDDEKLKKTRSSNKKKPKAKVSEDEKSDLSDSDSDEKPRKTRGSNTRKKPATPKAKAPKRAGGAGKGKGTGFTRAYKLSPQLSELMGADEMPRHAVVKRIWAIVKEKQLYDPNNKQFAICDDSLYKVIGKQRFRVFGMMKYLKTHFLLD